MTEREAFESWFSQEFRCDEWEYSPFSRMGFNGIDAYSCSTVNTVWLAWQAAKSQVDTKWISVKDALPPNDPYNREYWVYETLNNKVQHDYWVCPDSDLDQDFEPFFNNWFGSVTHWMPMAKYPKPPKQEKELNND